MVEPGTILEASAPPKTNSDTGLVRVECTAATENREKGWVTVRGNTGAAFLMEKTVHGDFMKSLDATLAELGAELRDTQVAAKKFVDAAARSTGPLAETKDEVMEKHKQ